LYKYIWQIYLLPLTKDEQYMYRCIELAKAGAGNVAPNPMVGAILVHNNSIIGEGYHQQYGKAHAEVNCIGQAIANGVISLISQSTLYVSLEPCAHFGKTPPCTDLIIKHKIPKVVIGCHDPFKEVDGKGIEKLKAAGIEVMSGILEAECKELNKRFFTFHIQHRPYIILKWAKTSDGFMAPPPPKGKASPSLSKGGVLESSISKSLFEIADSRISPLGGGGARLFISNEYTNRLVHKWRSEEAAILVGTNTALNDDPELTTRLWPGHSPVRIIVDMNLRLPSFLKIFDGKIKTIVFNIIRHEETENILYYQVTADVSLVHQIINALYQLKIQSVMIEGGARMLQSFIDENMWDEARVITNTEMMIGHGLQAPRLENVFIFDVQKISSDKVEIYRRQV
jgi:diaminohydroxyphosphoribosylaminopyrimidine deaminase/5-amino-6-(5-phosphoribosylamino)uracil reductase